jgi:hypothetical protein
MRRRRLKPNSTHIARKRAHFEADGGELKGVLSLYNKAKAIIHQTGQQDQAQHQNGQVEREKEDDIPFLLLF